MRLAQDHHEISTRSPWHYAITLLLQLLETCRTQGLPCSDGIAWSLCSPCPALCRNAMQFTMQCWHSMQQSWHSLTTLHCKACSQRAALGKICKLCGYNSAHFMQATARSSLLHKRRCLQCTMSTKRWKKSFMPALATR